MTTDELITELKRLGVRDDWAESFRDVRLNGVPGKDFMIPVATEDEMYYAVRATFTDDQSGYVPAWTSVQDLARG